MLSPNERGDNGKFVTNCLLDMPAMRRKAKQIIHFPTTKQNSSCFSVPFLFLISLHKLSLSETLSRPTCTLASRTSQELRTGERCFVSTRTAVRPVITVLTSVSGKTKNPDSTGIRQCRFFYPTNTAKRDLKSTL